MLCFLGLLVLASLALFSVRYRPLAREAFDCFFRRVTLRKCTTGLDRRLKKAMVTGRLVISHPGAARFLHRHLEALAWLFAVLVVGSTANLGYGFYNYSRCGNCNGPTGTSFCVFDPSGKHSRYSGVVTGHRGETVKPGNGGNPALGPAGARLTIIEFGSYTCSYARASEPVVREVVRQHAGEVRLVFPHFPLDGLDTLRAGAAIGCEDRSRATLPRPAAPAGTLGDHAGATRAAIAADCAGAQGRFWDYHPRLAASPDAIVTCAGLIELAREIGVDEVAFARCLEDPAMRGARAARFRGRREGRDLRDADLLHRRISGGRFLVRGARRSRGPGARSAPPVSLDPHPLRRDFPPLRDGRLVYFDNACMALRPQAVIDAVTAYYTEYPACGGGACTASDDGSTRRCRWRGKPPAGSCTPAASRRSSSHRTPRTRSISSPIPFLSPRAMWS